MADRQATLLGRLIDGNCALIARYPWLYVVVLLLTSGFFGYFYVTLPVETSLESLVIEQDADLQFYEAYKERFGDDQVLVVGFAAADVFAPEVLAFLQRQTRALEGVDGVADVLSLANAEDFVGSDSDFIVQPLFETLPQTPAECEAVRRRALASALMRDNLFNRDSSATLLLIRPQTRPSDPTFDERLVRRIEQHFSQLAPPWPGFETHLAGWLATDVQLSRFMNRDLRLFMPLTFGLLIVLVGLALRNRWLILLALLNVSVCLVWTLALLHLLGGAISPITAILPPLIMALAVADSIHIFSAFLARDRRQQPLPDSMRQTLLALALPCFLTSFTTAVGFASLAVSPVPPIRQFGLAAAGGMLAEFALSMTLIPLGIHFLRHKAGLKTASLRQRSPLHDALVRFAAWLPSRRRSLLLIALALLLLSAWSATGLRVETNLLEYFKKSSPVYRAASFIDQRLGGVETLEVALLAPAPDLLLEPQALALLQQIEDYLQGQAVVSQVTSFATFLREMNRAFHAEEPQHAQLPHSRALAAQYLLLYDGDEIGHFIDPQRQWTRISARITEHNSARLAAVIADLRAFLDQLTAGTDYQARITGKTLIANKLIGFIVQSQVESLALAFLLIFLTLLGIFRSLRLGLLAMLPNALPILFNFSVMGLCAIPLNSATAVIAAVAMGIAVDDTIHVLCAYQLRRAAGDSASQAVQRAVIDKGPALVATSLIMAGGFSILLFASFVPTIAFGFLSALIMLFALICDLLLLPALLLPADHLPRC